MNLHLNSLFTAVSCSSLPQSKTPARTILIQLRALSITLKFTDSLIFAQCLNSLCNSSFYQKKTSDWNLQPITKERKENCCFPFLLAFLFLPTFCPSFVWCLRRETIFGACSEVDEEYMWWSSEFLMGKYQKRWKEKWKLWILSAKRKHCHEEDDGKLSLHETLRVTKLLKIRFLFLHTLSRGGERTWQIQMWTWKLEPASQSLGQSF